MKKAIYKTSYVGKALEILLGGLLAFSGCDNKSKYEPKVLPIIGYTAASKKPITITEYFFRRPMDFEAVWDRGFCGLHMNDEERSDYRMLELAYSECKDEETREQLLNEMAKRLYREYKEIQEEKKYRHRLLKGK